MLERILEASCERSASCFFFYNRTPPTKIYPLSLHDALPILQRRTQTMAELKRAVRAERAEFQHEPSPCAWVTARPRRIWRGRSEEHTSELQSLRHLVCRLLLEKKKNGERELERVVALGGACP